MIVLAIPAAFFGWLADSYDKAINKYERWTFKEEWKNYNEK